MWTQLPLPQKGTEPPMFGPCLLWRNSCLDQDETWHGGRRRPWPHCVRWVPSSPPQRGTAAQFSVNAYCGQTARCISIPLGTEVGLSPGDIVLDGDPAPPPLKRHSHPVFGPCPLWRKYIGLLGLRLQLVQCASEMKTCHLQVSHFQSAVFVSSAMHQEALLLLPLPSITLPY